MFLGLLAGFVTSKNNGGFASVRSETWEGFSALRSAQGIRIEVQGDGKVYKLLVNSMYRSDFSTKNDGQWHMVDVPFSSFKAYYFGSLISSQASLSGSQVQELGFMVTTTSKFSEGSFRLAIRSISGF